MIYRSSFLKKRKYFHLTVQIADMRLSQTQLKTTWSELPGLFKKLPFLELHSCVLMSNHLHALGSVDESYFDFLEVSLSQEFRVPYPKGAHISRIESFAQYREVYRYIYRNPVEAGLVPMAELYPFSTLHELLGRAPNKLLPNDNMGLIVNPFPLLNWINWGVSSER
jgi:hypothetical protein